MLLSAVPHVPIGGAVLVAVGAVVALTAGELTQAAGGWDLSFRLAPPQGQVRYLSVFSLGMTAQTIVAPWVLTALVMPLGTPGWLAAAAVLALVALRSSSVLGPADRRPLP